MTALEHAGRVIRFDKRGTGLSDPTTALPSMDERVADLAAVMDAAGSPAAVVFGVSDGGRGAIAFSAAYPDRVLGLVLYGTSYRGPRPGLLGRYRSIVGRWGEGDLLELVAPSLAGPASREAAGTFERAAASPGMAAALSQPRAELRRITRRDYFPPAAREQAHAAVEALAGLAGTSPDAVPARQDAAAARQDAAAADSAGEHS